MGATKKETPETAAKLEIDVLALARKYDNPDILGEVLRDYVFMPDGSGSYGCYSTFATRDDFKPVEPESPVGRRLLKALYLDRDGDDEDVAWIIQAATLLSDGRIHCGWYWDGDGVLAFLVDGVGVVNTDCKKAHEWEWVKRP